MHKSIAVTKWHYSLISICKFKSSSVGSFSSTSLETYLLSSNEDIPIGTLVLFNDHFAVNLSLFLQSNNPIVWLSVSFFIVSFIAVT